MLIIRPEQSHDITAISQLLQQAFANHPYSINDEYLLVERLRKQNLLTLSLVAVIEGEVVGYIAFTPITIDGNACNWLGLAPLAVLPNRQRQHIGMALINEAVSQLTERGFDGCMLIGDPHYYAKVGFAPAAPFTYDGVDAQYFMQRAFKASSIALGKVEFHPTFYTD